MNKKSPKIQPHRALPIDPDDGPRRWIYSVQVRRNGSRLCRTLAEDIVEVTATDPRAALEDVAVRLDWRPETELMTWGPRGGVHELFISWERSIGEHLIQDILRREKSTN